nr:uncharacterized protein LOC129452894 isoform X2 [Misgurnus anguillicaudatus]
MFRSLMKQCFENDHHYHRYQLDGGNALLRMRVANKLKEEEGGYVLHRPSNMKKFSLLFIISLFINGVVADERESVSVMEGDSVTLHNTKIQRDYLIEWRFGDVIAKINGGANKISINDDVLDGRFRDRLQVNKQTGDLTITDITTQHSGDYQLQIINIHTTRKTFNICVFDYRQKVKTVTVGDSLILYNNVTKKTEDEKMVWSIRHNNSPVAKIIRNGIEFTYNVHDERFRDRLKVDDQTRDLIITNIRPEDSGSYEINITVGRHLYTIHRLFSVNVKEQDQSSDSRSRTVIIAVIIIVVLVLVLVVALAVVHRSRTAGNGDRKNESDSINCGGGADDDGTCP